MEDFVNFISKINLAKGYRNRELESFTEKFVEKYGEYVEVPIKELLDGKKSTELFLNIDNNRIRRYLWYQWPNEENLVEYEQSGEAWNMDTLVKTGKEFNR